MAYSKKVVEKFESTLNEPEKNSVGRWNPSDSDIGTGMVGAPACGDVMRLQIKCEPKNNSHIISCLLYTSPSPRDYAAYRMPSSA